MKSLLAFFLLMAFILWLLPLGYFIKPSQEKTLCNGQRAICMCHALVFKTDKGMEPGFNFKTGAVRQENQVSPSNHFITEYHILPANLSLEFSMPISTFLYINPFIAVLDSVPKP